jgi:hypothetical protein
MYYSNKVIKQYAQQNSSRQEWVAYLFFSASFGLLIVNLHSDARKEFKGSIAQRIPHA